MRFAPLILFLGSTLCAQVVGPGLPYYAGGASASVLSPTNIPGALTRYYWDYLMASTNGTAIADLPDAIQSNPLGQTTTADQPTNSPTGIGFKGSPVFLTNSPFIFATGDGVDGNTGSVFMVVKFITPGSSLGPLIANTDAGGEGVYYTSGHVLESFQPSGNPTIATIPSGTLLDLYITQTNATFQGVGARQQWFTNGVSITTVSDSFASEPFEFVGSDRVPNGFFTGWIQTIVWYSNVLSGAQIATLHKWATNRPDGGNNVPGP